MSVILVLDLLELAVLGLSAHLNLQLRNRVEPSYLVQLNGCFRADVAMN